MLFPKTSALTDGYRKHHSEHHKAQVPLLRQQCLITSRRQKIHNTASRALPILRDLQSRVIRTSTSGSVSGEAHQHKRAIYQCPSSEPCNVVESFKESLHCTACNLDHPGVFFSPAQRGLPRSHYRVCIGHQGRMSICDHSYADWDQIQRMKNAGVHFRNQMEVGPGGKQIQLEDPDGNPIELFEPTRQ